MFKAMLWQGQVLWGMMVYDSLRAVDWLVDPRRRRRQARIATLGISMGSTMAWWLAALDERVKVDRRHLLPHRLPGAARQEEPLGARRLLLRAAPAEALHDRADQRAHRAARAPRPGRPPGQADAGRRTRPHRPRTAAGLRRSRAMPNAGSCCATTSAIWRRPKGARRSSRSCTGSSEAICRFRFRLPCD